MWGKLTEKQSNTDKINFRSPWTVPISGNARNRCPEHDVC
jgi:hypothetical protein